MKAIVYTTLGPPEVYPQVRMHQAARRIAASSVMVPTLVERRRRRTFLAAVLSGRSKG